jgi:DNA-directed RNA polymerase specialized sigma subunit
MHPTAEPDAPARPPHGPYAECRYDAGRRKWVRSLTEGGRSLVTQYLEPYEPTPARVLWVTHPRLAAVALAGNPDHEPIHQAARVGVVEAAVRYVPVRNGRPVSFKTVAVWGIRSAVQTYLGLRPTARRLKTTNSEPGSVLTAPDDGADPEGGVDDRDLWSFVNRSIDGVERLVVVGHYRHGLTFKEAGRLVGLSGERARQIGDRAVKKLGLIMTRPGR